MTHYSAWRVKVLWRMLLIMTIQCAFLLFPARKWLGDFPASGNNEFIPQQTDVLSENQMSFTVIRARPFVAEVKKRVNRHGFIIIPAVIDHAYVDMARNFYESSIKRLQLENNTLFVCAEQDACDEAQRQGLPVYLYKDIARSSGLFGSKEFIQKETIKLDVINEIINSGHGVLLTDLDMFWFKSPIDDVIKNCGDKDFVVQNETFNTDLNIGFMYIRPTRASKNLFKKMMRFSGSECAQDIFNKFVRTHKSRLKYKVLSVDAYPNGVTYFETHGRILRGQNPCEQCLLVHNNWIVGTEAKVFRFKEHHMWYLDDKGYFSDPNARYLVYENVLGPSGTENITALERGVLKGALAIAKILNRTLILPQRFHSKNREVTALNGILIIKVFDKYFNHSYRESTFLDHSLVPLHVKKGECGPLLIKNNFSQSTFPDEEQNMRTVFQPNDMENGAMEGEIRNWLTSTPFVRCQVLRFHSMYRVFKSFDKPEVQRDFNQMFDKAVLPGGYRQLKLFRVKQKL